ncbi:MAG: DNA polymerase III subunit delta [Terrimicrobiaceae bacterium]|nr:DNA polymerase III subunit delta [Terrimicrobiaceae bacterium]
MTSKKNATVYFVTGSDEADVKKTARALADELAPGADAFGLETIDGAIEGVDAAVEKIRETRGALLTLPFLGGTKLVWLKNATFLGDSQTGRSESVIGALEILCETLEAGLPDGVTFLISAPEPDKRRTAYKRLTKVGVTKICDKPDLGFRSGEGEIVDWTASRARAKGLKIAHDAVEALAARVGLDSGQLDNELEKLQMAFGHAHPITAEDVRTLVPATRESGIFDVGNAISSRNLKLALDTLDHLFYQGERGIGILLASIVPTIRNLLFVKDLMVRHRLQPPSQPNGFASVLNRLPASEIDHLPRKKDGTLNTYGLGIAAQNSTHYTLEELRRAFLGCAEANLQLVSSQGSESTVLVRLLTGFMAPPRRR